MIVLSFIQVESNYDKKEPWERVCGFLIEVLSLFKFGITEIWCYYFLNSGSHEEKNLWNEQLLILF